MSKKIPYRITGITGIELGEHAHHDIEFLICGNNNLTYKQHCIIFKYVFDYIKCSKRFLIV
jgi:hypothetical protein